MSGVVTTDLGKNRTERARQRKQAAPAPTDLPPLLTRQQLVAFLNGNGIPVSESVLNKLCSQKFNQGPPVAQYWGKRALYEPQLALKWARSKLRDRPTDISAQADAA